MVEEISEREGTGPVRYPAWDTPARIAYQGRLGRDAMRYADEALALWPGLSAQLGTARTVQVAIGCHMGLLVQAALSHPEWAQAMLQLAFGGEDPPGPAVSGLVERLGLAAIVELPGGAP